MNFRCVLSIKKLPKDYVVPLLWPPASALIPVPYLVLAGSITAALFLSRFVTRDSGWIHADIYGWNRSAAPARPYGGEAHAIRALFTMIADRYG